MNTGEGLVIWDFQGSYQIMVENNNSGYAFEKIKTSLTEYSPNKGVKD